ncbi:helix-turn-helix domain-containing protein [Salipiger abyssi]|uniref:Transcriptional regulator, MerR family n=1 Tax=Salipiger abyssi TaxID=1250539 RepID=A0A1P8UR29_9RHOB|nr:helix-turn-helix domain-containing protein [Salipiger abyssi]APZ51778.1 transcriptional regulator, MerR family [Salipiger abyssi]
MLDIAEVARQSGIPASTLRYYEEQGLIRSAGRRGLRRIFEPDVLTRLSLISLGQIAGFSLAEIAEILRDHEAPAIARERLLDKADALDLRIRELTALRDGLRHTARCTAPSHLECPSFRRLMRVALAHAARRRRAAARAVD